ncbi:glycosyltransferase family 2 protein|uniref:Rhamnosyltransferase n=1 Tax=Dendrosporobacter quercicolus TaxID=146817 RepID=A0A1G9WQ86_9FIRM|nr:glycosyltransferase family 2 protein [Dendrosporobacter quercicolus]NSL49176.1 glycosyltransferase family 2 protein [Dendrosporobacter quercicolus DSM 1736]SDM86567.1 rhamnosyltransferase [Dendrosporobacter quercicolus]
MKKTAVIIPTYNGGRIFKDLLTSLKQQRHQPLYVIVIDSSSCDGTDKLAESFGINVITISQADFNHGKTRQKGVEICLQAEILVFLTQDTIFTSNNSLGDIIRCFDNSKIGVAYGRQLPHKNASPLGAHARFFNYPEKNEVKSMDNAKKLGMKAVFISNSFAAYRREALIAIGGFPTHTILGEDMYVAAKMLLAGWKIAYCADSSVYHSHDYNLLQEFRRYFDIGVFHAKESWIRDQFGGAEGEGFKFILSEMKYLLNNNKWKFIPSAFIRTGLKFMGYRLGLGEKKIPISIKRLFSMHSNYWNSNIRSVKSK